MAKKSFICCFLLVSIWTLNLYSQSTRQPCDLPPPENLTVLEIGTTWVTVGWDQAMSGSGYQISIYAIGNPNPLETFTTTNLSTTNYTFTGLLPGIDYKIKIVTTCEGHVPGLKYQDIDITTIVLDLLLGIQNVSPTTTFCEKSINNLNLNVLKCPLPVHQNSIFLGEFMRNEDGRVIRFGIKYNKDSEGFDHFEVWAVPVELYKNVADKLFYITSEQDLDHQLETGFFYIKDRKYPEEFEILGRFYITESGPDFYLEFRQDHIFTYLGPQPYDFLVYYNAPGLQDPSNREGSNSILNLSPSILPNPTTTTLQIQIPTTFTTQIQGTLLNLSGSVIQRYGLEPGVNTVSTANLSPGIYFLRLEGPGYAETFKVVKVE